MMSPKPVGILVITLILFVILQSIHLNVADLFLRRTEILDGQIYRLITSQLVHLNWTHLIMNFLGLALTLFLFPTLARIPLLILAVVFIGLFVSIGLLVFFPGIQWYTGFSGINHGLLILGALLAFRELHAKLILIVILAKNLWEISSGGDTTSAQLIGTQVIYQSHSLGIISGAFFAVMAYFFIKKVP